MKNSGIQMAKEILWEVSWLRKLENPKHTTKCVNKYIFKHVSQSYLMITFDDISTYAQ